MRESHTEAYFSFTRGRFLRDETEELSKRYVEFKVKQLGYIGARATGAQSCVNLHKFADGMHNKAFLLTMDDDSEAVGKIPNPNAGLPFFSTASEVATMDFMRSTLGIPIPKVLSWSSNRDNPVGAEYIIMEKAPGIQLDSLWHKLDAEARLKVVKRIAKYQADWTAMCFTQFSSLYYKTDLPPSPSLEYTDKEGKQIIDDRFAIGPSTSRQNIDDGRKNVEFDRGPYLPYMAKRPSHTENIFVNPDDPSEILGIIDWQSTELAPLYDHIIEPYVLEYDGPPVEGLLERPDLAEIRKQFDSDPASQKKTESLYIKMSLVSLYRHLIHLTNPRLFRALEFQRTAQFRLLLFARNLLVDGEATYRALLVEFQKDWPDLARVCAENKPKYPLTFTDEEKASITADSEGAARGIDLMQDVQERVGREFFQAQGLVDHAQFNEAKEALRRVKADFIREHSSNDEEEREWEDAWPFDD